MYEIDVSYAGPSKFKVTSLNYELSIDFPKPGGTADGITPPALLLASVGSCLAVYIERYLLGAKIKFDKFLVNVKSDIAKESPHYLKIIDVAISIPGVELDDRRKGAFLDFIRNCPVHNTLVNKPVFNISLQKEDSL